MSGPLIQVAVAPAREADSRGEPVAGTARGRGLDGGAGTRWPTTITTLEGSRGFGTSRQTSGMKRMSIGTAVSTSTTVRSPGGIAA